MNSIVITTFERPEVLSQCLRALSRQKGIDDAEIIVVDDGGQCDLKAIERVWKSQMNLRLMKIPHSGRAEARNRGVRAASGRRVLFLGDDVFVRSGWLGRHIETGADDPLIAVLGPYPLELPENGRRCSEAFREVMDPVNLKQFRDPDDAGFAFFATGNLSMDRETFLTLGGFDPRFKLYGWEDIDLGYRFEKYGGRLIYDENAKAVHHHPPMSHEALCRREFELGVTAYQFWNKWKDDDLDYMKFWDETWESGPEWRRELGRRLIQGIEFLAPRSGMLPRLYERLIWSYRFAGVVEGRRMFGATPPVTPSMPAAGASA